MFKMSIFTSENKRMSLAEGIRHMEFVVRLYRNQVEAGRVFIHESPAHATSWALPAIRKMKDDVGVDVVEADQCMYGLKTWGGSTHKLVPAKKPTKFLTNSTWIAQALSRRCKGKHSWFGFNSNWYWNISFCSSWTT